MLFQKMYCGISFLNLVFFCGSYDLMVQVFKPKPNDMLSLMTRTWLRTLAQVFNFTSLPFCISASQRSCFSSSTFASKHPFLCLLSEFFLLQSIDVSPCSGTVLRPPCVTTTGGVSSGLLCGPQHCTYIVFALYHKCMQIHTSLTR